MPSWDPKDYSQNARAQAIWADELMNLLDLRGDEAILDIGSGDGRVTASIADRVPSGMVVGLDASAQMVGHARAEYGQSRTNLEFVLGDMQAIPFAHAFDRVFSNAALHWAPDQSKVVAGVARALVPGGRAILQMGGAGNAGPVLDVLKGLLASEPWDSYFPAWEDRYSFPDDCTYAALLERAALEPVEVSLLPRTMLQQGAEGLAGWIRTTWLLYTESVPTNLREVFVQAIVHRYLALHPPDDGGMVSVPMVRLQVVAVRR